MKHKPALLAMLLATTAQANIPEFEVSWTAPIARQDGTSLTIDKTVILIYEEGEIVPYKTLETTGEVTKVNVGTLKPGKNRVEVYVMDDYGITGIRSDVVREVPSAVAAAVTNIQLRAVITVEVSGE